MTRSHEISAAGAAKDIAVLAAASIALFVAEQWARGAGILNWGDESTGVVAVVGAALLSLLIVVSRGQSLRDIGLTRPKHWRTVPFWVLGITAAFLVAQNIVPMLLAPYFDAPPPDMSRYASLYQNPSAAIAMAAVLPLTASIPEELIYRGFLMDRLTRIFGATAFGAAITALVQALVFGAVHFQWGAGGMLMAMVMGVVWGASFLLCGRNLWIVILAHSFVHLLFVAQLFSTPPAAG